MSTGIRLSEYEVTGLACGVGWIRLKKQGKIEEYLFTFAGRNLVVDPVLIAVAFIPLEARDAAQIDHICILS
jgi:hypothetical protein